MGMAHLKGREPAIWMLMHLRGTTQRSLSICRLCAHSECWLDGGARMLGLLVVPHPSQKVHDRGLHEGLTESARWESHRLSCLTEWVRIFRLSILIESERPSDQRQLFKLKLLSNVQSLNSSLVSNCNPIVI